MWSPQGIGGDDRCGVYAILKIAEKFRPYILFTTDEEIGALGASDFAKNTKDLYDVNFIIEIDRRGFNQAVFYDCGNEDFKKFILSFGFEEEYGTFSDISVISPKFDVASVNLSAGYYNEHNKHEYIVMEDLIHTINMVERILKDVRIYNYYDYQEVVYTNKYGYDYAYNNYGIVDDPKKTVEKDKKKETEKKEETQFYDVEMEEDWYVLNNEDWYEVYGFKKPKTEEDLYSLLCDR